jgi:hypothetical protein
MRSFVEGNRDDASLYPTDELRERLLVDYRRRDVRAAEPSDS